MSGTLHAQGENAAAEVAACAAEGIDRLKPYYLKLPAAYCALMEHLVEKLSQRLHIGGS